MFEGPHSGHGGTQMPRNWGARGLSACPKLRSLWISKKACYSTLESPENHTAKHWDVFWGVQAWLWSSYPDCCAPGERSKGMQVASWVEMMAAKIQCLVGYFEFDKKTWNWMYLPPKMMILWSIVRCFISFVFCKLFKLFLNVLEIVDCFFFGSPKNRFKTSLAQSLRRAMA